jgi:hypothetical protein
VLKVVVNRPPRDALPFARAAAATGVPVLFLLPHGRPGAGRRAGVDDPDALRALTALGHELGLHADPAQLGDDLGAGLEHASAPFAAAGLRLAAAGLRHDEKRPFDATAPATGRRRIPYWIDAVCVANGGERFVPTFAVTQVRDRIHARHLDPDFPVHVASLDALDAVTVASLVDTVARAVCVHELRLSSLT